MKKKSFLLSILGIILFSLVCGYSLVFAGHSVEKVTKISNNIYVDSLKLNNVNIVLKSSLDLNTFKIKGNCAVDAQIKEKINNYYLYEIGLIDKECDKEKLFVTFSNEKQENTFILSFDLYSNYRLYSDFLDKSSSELNQLLSYISKGIGKFSKKRINTVNEKLINNRKIEELTFIKTFITSILEKRDQKYIVPVLGHEMPNTAVKIPNSGRGYRSDYTDGIHHGWDIDGDFGEQVIALDDAIVIRVVSGFNFSDLNAIKRGNNLTKNDKIRNLDILRGNQIWLKTMSGDVVMYSHLSDINSNIKVGKVVNKGQPLGAIGITGVPDKNYKDYHLHFVVHVNPFNLSKSKSYDIDDYMEWDWLFKGETKDYIVQNQNRYFE